MFRQTYFLSLFIYFIFFNLSHTEEVVSVYSRIPDSYLNRVNTQLMNAPNKRMRSLKWQIIGKVVRAIQIIVI